MISTEIAQGFATFTLARPEKANSLTGRMLQELCDAVDRVAQDPDLRVLTLTGQGGVFSAGADLDEARAGLALSPLWEQLSARIAALPCLTIAALNGTVAGGALGMVLACDLRIAVPSAKIFYPVMKLGFLPQPSDAVRMSALIGPARARMILMAGQKIPAPEALAWGLVDRLVEPGELMAAARELGADAMGASLDHVKGIKGLIPAGI